MKKNSMNTKTPFIAVALAFASTLAVAQQTVPFQNGVPVAPTGLAGQPLGDGPWTYKTGEGMDIRVSVVARLDWPYAIAFLPTGEALITTRTGTIRMLGKDGKLVPQPVTGGPPAVFRGTSGSLGAVHGYTSIVVHPKFAQNHWVYFAFNRPAPTAENANAYAGGVMRARLDGMQLKDVTEIMPGQLGRGAMSLAMTPDDRLWISMGGDAPAQDVTKLAGKTLRLTDDGKPAPGNPFADGKDGARPEIYTMGHRSSMGLTVQPGTGEVFLAEMGPNGGDEINWLKPGKNYGWPLVSLGRTYPGPWQAKGANMPTHAGFEPPIVYWTPSISVAGLTFYTGDKLPKWKGDLFVSGLRTGEVPGTGHLDRVLLNPQMEELRRESLLNDLHQRIRDVKQGPDGYLYVLTDEEQGAVLRISAQ